MSDIHILVIDDEPGWLQNLSRMLRRRLGAGVDIHTSDGTDAAKKIRNEDYAVITIDLDLPGAEAVNRGPELTGMHLMGDLRSNNSRNRHCRLVVLTGYPNLNRMRRAYENYKVHSFLEKDAFGNGEDYVNAVRSAMLEAFLKQAEINSENRYRFEVSFNENSLTGGKLSGPDNHAEYSGNNSRFDAEDLARRANDVNFRIINGNTGDWRAEARSIGRAVYEVLNNQNQIMGGLARAQALAHPSSNLWLQFSSSASGLGIPFELLRDDEGPLVFRHILTRRLSQGSWRKPKLFHEFLNDLIEKKEELRVLIVGADSDGTIPDAVEEAKSLAKSIKAELELFGIPNKVTPLIGEKATYKNVQKALHHDRCHIFHYAGHGDHDNTVPEKSPLVLSDRNLTASDLNLLVRNTDLQLIFLSCCLSARTGTQVGRGDFHSLMQALSQADVPAILGYRWEISDASALRLAEAFYKALWRSFCPGKALLKARYSIALGEEGFDDDAWASPILLMQNA